MIGMIPMSLNCMSFDRDWYDAIVSGQYLNGWLHNGNMYLLFAISGVDQKFTFLLYVAILFVVTGVG